MTDKKLLELAAKAAGYAWTQLVGWHPDLPRDDASHWNPLTDDGDALRLAMRLKINVLHMSHLCPDYWIEAGIGNSWLAQERVSESDVHTASRRAIVRAAAAIGAAL